LTTLAPTAAPVDARATGLFRSTVGRKAIMAVTGVVLLGFVFLHMVGNLQLYLGRAALNHYAAFLRQFLHGGGIWIARAVLLGSVGLHIWSATTLTLDSWRARPVRYRRWEPDASDYASRTIRWSAYILFLFIVFHLMDLTFGNANPSFVPGDVYGNVVSSFSSWPVAVAYIVAMLALGLHVRHGVWSLCRTLGVRHPRYVRMARTFALLFALTIVVGNCSFPLAVLLGWVR
jgi:succinate dehydrogenase / fumarate reductase cytochrome b subunit